MTNGAIEQVVALRRDERYADAEAAAARELDHATHDARRLIEAEIARLEYYSGKFLAGADRAVRLIGPSDLASARAAVAASVNLLALNNGHGALRSVRDAVLRFRVLNADMADMTDAHVQLVHVLAHMGDHREAEADARAALRLARGARLEPEVARAEYALGFALWFAGSRAAVDHLLSAEARARLRAGTFWHWILFCLATCLRDLGYLEPADAYATRSGVALRYERAWFLVRSARSREAIRWIRPPISTDEIPFMRAVAAAIRLTSDGVRASGRPLRSAVAAANAFRRGGLDHWRWGALWIAAADTSADPRQRSALLEDLADELSERSARHWGFFEPRFVDECAKLTTRQEIRGRLRDLAPRSVSTDEVSALLPSLRLLNPEAMVVLTESGLTPAEIRTVTAALDLWLESGALRRVSLAGRLRISEASVRSRMNVVRQKFGIAKVRGGEPLVSWLAERDLLAPPAQRRALEILSKH